MRKILVIAALSLWAVPAYATDVTHADKSSGGTLTATEQNQIKTAVNSKQNQAITDADGDFTTDTVEGALAENADDINTLEAANTGDQIASGVTATDEFGNSDSTNVQDVLDDLDQAITDGGGGTDDQTIDALSLGGTTLSISLEDDGEAPQTVDLAGLQDGTGTDDQTATEVTATDEFGNSDSTNVQDVLDDLDQAITDGGGGGTDDQTIDTLSLGGTTLSISLEDDGEVAQTVDLAGLQDGTGTDDQTATEVTATDEFGNSDSTNVQDVLDDLDQAITDGDGTPTDITVADTTDTTAYIGIFESATGDLGPKTDAGITYDAGTGTLTVTVLEAGTVSTTRTDGSASEYYIYEDPDGAPSTNDDKIILTGPTTLSADENIDMAQVPELDEAETITGNWVNTANPWAGNEIADDAIDSNHYAAASIDNEHLADDAVDSDEIASGAVDLAHMSANSVDSDQYVDGSIDNAHLANDAVDSDEIADGAVDFAHLAADAKFQSLQVSDLNDTSTPSVLTAEETTNKVLSNYKSTGADHVFTLPTAHAAGNVIFQIGDEFQVDVEPPSGTSIYLEGTAAASDEHIVNADDTVLDRMVCYCPYVNGAYVWACYSDSFDEATP